MGKDDRKAKVTAENLREAARLRELWESRSHPSQAEFGDLYKVGNQSAVGQFLRGEIPLSLNAARGFAQGLGCEVKDFSPRLADIIQQLSATSWPLGDEVTPSVWATLPDPVKTKIRSDAEYIVREYREKAGKSAGSSRGGSPRKAA